MGRKRTTAVHILSILKEYEGKALRFKDIRTALYNRGWKHTDQGIVNNLNWLLEQKHIVKVQDRYGIPKLRENGYGYLTMYSPFEEREGIIVETKVEALKKSYPVLTALGHLIYLRKSGIDPAYWKPNELNLMYSWLTNFAIPKYREELEKPEAYLNEELIGKKLTVEQARNIVKKLLDDDLQLLEKVKKALEKD